MDFKTIVQTLGIAAIVSSAVAFVLRGLFNQMLSRDLEKFKTDLKVAAFEHQTRFARLHEDRARVIAELYKLFGRAQSAFTEYIKPLQRGGDEEFKARGKEAAERTNEFFAYFDDNRIYFDEPLCRLIEELGEKYRRAWSEFTVFPDMKPVTGDAWWNVWESFTRDVPPLRSEIEKRARKMLGVETGEVSQF